MTQQPGQEHEPQEAPGPELPDYPPILDAVLPAIMLVVSAGYAISLIGIREAEMNLLLLRPLFVVVWVLLAIVILRETLPAIRRQAVWNKAARARPKQTLAHRFRPATQLGALLVLIATWVFSFFGPGDGHTVYIVSTFIYVTVVGLLMGDRNPLTLLIRAAFVTGLLYLVMGVLLGVRL